MKVRPGEIMPTSSPPRNHTRDADDHSSTPSTYEAQAFYEYGDSVTGIELKLDDIDRADAVAKEIMVRLNNGIYNTMTWSQLNHGLFTWRCWLQRLMMRDERRPRPR